MVMKVIGLSDKGLVRQKNEDSFLIREKEGIFAVCDGMGGHKGGDIASNMAVKIIEEEIDNHYDAVTLDVLNQSITKANQMIWQSGHQNSDWYEMGTTITLVKICDLKMEVCHVGDSRLYLIRGNHIIQITKDHTLAEEMADSGIINNKQKSYSHILTRALGVSEKLEIDNYSVDLCPEDVILLCSDGLSDMLSDEDIISIVQESDDLVKISHNLLQGALNNGGYDNITLIMVSIMGGK